MCVCVLGDNASAWLPAPVRLPAAPDPAPVHPAPAGAEPVCGRPTAYDAPRLPAPNHVPEQRGEGGQHSSRGQQQLKNDALSSEFEIKLMPL